MNPTFIGSIAILMWSTLALLTVGAKNIPPFELITICFSVSFLIGLLWCFKNNINLFKNLNHPFHVWAIGVGGLFGYHLFYFLALKYAPPLESNLINYLWPLLIVVFSSFLPNEKLHVNHIIGVICGLIGTIFIFLDKGDFSKFSFHIGYIYALLAAFTWSGYSVISRKFAQIPSFLVAGFSLVVAVFSLMFHLAFEQSVIPTTNELGQAILLGLAPVGGAFYLWDVGVKKGNIQLLGTLCYSIPLISSLFLILFGYAKGSINIFIACFFIVLGSFISSKKYKNK